MTKKLLLAVLFICILLKPAYASGNGEDFAKDLQKMIEQASFHVESASALKEALRTAQDGDIIAVDVTIELAGNSDYVFFTNKEVTLVRTFQYNPMFKIRTNYNTKTTISGFTIYGVSNTAEIVSIQGGEAIIENCTFAGCNEQQCNSIYVWAGSTKIINCRFLDALRSPIFIQFGATANVEKCIFINNHGKFNDGGAICNGGTLSIVNSVILNNQAAMGGGISNNDSLTIDNCIFWNNISVDGEGADIWSDGILTIRGEYGDAGFFDENTREKIDLPLESFTGHLELVYISEEEPDLSGLEDANVTQKPPQQPHESGDQSGNNEDRPPQEGENDDPTENPPEGTETPGESPASSSDQGKDNSSDNTHDTPQRPQEPADSSGDGNKPSVDHRPAKPSDTGAESTDTDTQPGETSTSTQPALVCNGAAIDTSRTVLLLGYGDGLLHREDPLTRAQMATIIFRLLDEDSISLYRNVKSTFTDVAVDAWYTSYINVIEAAGIVNGVGGGRYDPEGLLTWGQTLTILSRFVEPKEYTLKYIQYDGWATQAAQTAVAYGWIDDSIVFVPDAVISRGQLEGLINGVLALYR